MRKKVIIVLGVLTVIIIISTARANLTNLGYSEKTETIWKVFLGLTIFVAFALCWISGIILKFIKAKNRKRKTTFCKKNRG